MHKDVIILQIQECMNMAIKYGTLNDLNALRYKHTKLLDSFFSENKEVDSSIFFEIEKPMISFWNILIDHANKPVVMNSLRQLYHLHLSSLYKAVI